MAAVIRALVPQDDRSQFRSDDIELDRFFQLFAGQNQFRHHIGVTYVTVDGATILGFATVAAASLETSALAAVARRRLPAYPLPVLRLARLAVDHRARRKRVAEVLLRFCFSLAHDMARRVGCVGVVVDAKIDAVAFYERYGFFALEAEAGRLRERPEPTPMFLEIGSIPALGTRSDGG